MNGKLRRKITNKYTFKQIIQAADLRKGSTPCPCFASLERQASAKGQGFDMTPRRTELVDCASRVRTTSNAGRRSPCGCGGGDDGGGAHCGAGRGSAASAPPWQGMSAAAGPQRPRRRQLSPAASSGRRRRGGIDLHRRRPRGRRRLQWRKRRLSPPPPSPRGLQRPRSCRWGRPPR